ncbi:integration host factor, actinobacterial type [Spelaeicoccus albus]|uniref:Integration host factor-like helix-two turn-helix domain-containing protein n=1 Tax=Spelaeicoccus albus TaxID=1280376 RepID=A0A7Z0D4A9_9MICO|nr:integration host factor, actinobacterial type [Spelaeicoccus albus]NYI68603.1 hypothetical protein [Spelaeicoccus albus]
MALSPLSPQQRAEALDKAAAARRVRAAVKDDLRTGKTSLRAVLDKSGSDEALGKLKVSSLLEALPGIGKVRAAQLMEEIGIAGTRRLRGLGTHQRRALLERFETS